jgi:hypothetical protein
MKLDTKLSTHLRYGEAIRSRTALRQGLPNIPTSGHLLNMFILANNLFEPIREHFGTPIYVSSFYRTAAINSAIGGAKGSDHLIGCAIDLDADVFGGITNMDIFLYVLTNLPFWKLIYEHGDEENPAWVHISYKQGYNHMKTVLRAVYEDGETVYKPFDEAWLQK